MDQWTWHKVWSFEECSWELSLLNKRKGFACWLLLFETYLVVLCSLSLSLSLSLSRVCQCVCVCFGWWVAGVGGANRCFNFHVTCRWPRYPLTLRWHHLVKYITLSVKWIYAHSLRKNPHGVAWRKYTYIWFKYLSLIMWQKCILFGAIILLNE
jgi:hypothetical protein